MLVVTGCSSNTDSVFYTSTSNSGYSTTTTSTSSGTSTSLTTQSEENIARVPWDYKIVEGSVGDLINSDMTVLPDYQLLPNDDNYATGEQIWLLQFMDAEMVTDDKQRNEIRLSAWRTIKSYKTKEKAEEDMSNLKIAVTTEVDMIGVYKTEFKGETRNFAVVELPSGHRIKQPIDDKRFTDFEKKKKVNVQLEEIHDFADYDLAYAKFRGWAK
ncbi:signal peptide protein [Paenibacillus sp. GSMTC-2017]|nr:hypothetical protein [Paenibacillus sp. GSMTC-2017]MBH5319978.1 signal peptide protein [Paenibacillus sp. GSMTC-2017]